MKLFGYELLKAFHRKALWVLIAAMLGCSVGLYVSDCYRLHESEISTRADLDALVQQYAVLPEQAATDKVKWMINELNDYQSLQFNDDMIAQIRAEKEQNGSAVGEEDAETEFDEEALCLQLNEQLEANNPAVRSRYEASAYYADQELLRHEIQLYSELHTQYEAIGSFHEFVSSTQDRADQMLSVSIFSKPGTFSYRNILQTVKDFMPLSDIRLSAGQRYGVSTVSEFRVMDFALLAVLFFLAIVIFLTEKENGLTALLRPTRHGHVRLFCAKLGALLLLGTIITVVYYGVLISAGRVLFGYGDLSRPIQSVSDFRDCTLHLSVGQYLALMVAGKVLAALFALSLFALVFTFISGAKICFALLGVYLVGSYLCYAFIYPSSVFQFFKYVNLFCCMDSAQFWGQYVNLNLFGFPVNKLPLCLGVGAVLGVLCAVLCGVAFLHTPSSAISAFFARIGGKLFRRGKKPSLRGTTSLFAHESSKLLWQNKVAWVLLAVAFFTFRAINTQPLMMEQKTAFYKVYIDQFAGPLTPEKDAQIEAEKLKFDTIGEQFAALAQQYANGKITQDELVEQRRALNEFSHRSEGFAIFYAQVEQVRKLSEEQGFTGSLIDSLSSDRVFNNFSSQIGTYLLYVAALILCLSPLFPAEQKNGILPVLRATRRGKRPLLRTKYLVAFLVSIVLLAIVVVPESISFASKYTIADLSAPIQCIKGCEAITLHVSVGQVLAAWAVLAVLGAIGLSVVILTLSQLAGKQTAAILFSAAVSLLPPLAVVLRLSGAELLCFAGAFTLPRSLCKFSPAVLAIDFAAWAAACTGLYFVSRRRFCGVEK